MVCLSKQLIAEILFYRVLITPLKNMSTGFLPDYCAKFCRVSVSCAKANKGANMTQQKIVEYFAQSDCSNSAFAVRARKHGNTPSGFEVFGLKYL